MKDSKRLGLPLLIMILSTLVVYILTNYITGTFVDTLLTMVIAISFFLFGCVLNMNKRKNSSVYRKVIALVLTIILVFMQLDAISLPLLDQLRVFLNINPMLTGMLYIFFGYVFVD